MTSLLAALTLLAHTATTPQPIATPASSTGLSVFQQGAEGTCTWLRVDPIQGRRDLVANLPHDCAGVSAAWSPDGSQAIIEFPVVDDRGAMSRDAWIADVSRLPAKIEQLPLPEDTGLLDVIAFDLEGTPVALFLELLDDATSPVIEHRGKRWTVPESLPGAPALAHAWRFERGRWSLHETVPTTWEACGAPGTRRLDVAHRLARSTTRLLDTATGHHVSREPIGAELFEMLEAFERADDGSTYAWVRLETDRGAVLALEGGAEYAFLTTPVLLLDEDDGIRELEGVAENALLAIESRGRWLLLEEAVSGSRPLLYDLDGGRLVFAPANATGVTFWP